VNYSTAIFLINPDVRCVVGTYEPDVAGAPGKAKRELFKTFDKTIAVGDLVVVPTDTRHKATVVKIVETDMDIDVETAEQVRWIVDRVDMRQHTKLLAQEGQAIAAIKAAELRHKRDQLREKLFANHAAKLQELPIAKGPEAIAAAPELPPDVAEEA